MRLRLCMATTLCLLRYFPSINLGDRADNCYTSLYFFSPPFLCLFNIEFQNLLLYVPSVPSCSFLLSFPSYSFLFFFLSAILCSVFFPAVYSLYFLIFLIVFFSNLLSFLFSFLLLCSVCFSLMLYSY